MNILHSFKGNLNYSWYLNNYPVCVCLSMKHAMTLGCSNGVYMRYHSRINVFYSRQFEVMC